MNVKWGKQKLEGVKLDTSEPVELFKAQLYTLTQVPPERQKIMGVKGGAVKARRPPACRPLHPPRARRAPTPWPPRGHAACGARHSTLAQDNANWEDLKVKEQVENGDIYVQYVSTAKQIADALSKNLNPTLFGRFAPYITNYVDQSDGIVTLVLVNAE